MLTNEEIIDRINNLEASKKTFPKFEGEEFKDYEVIYSALDPMGVVITKDDKIYRGVYQKSKDKFIELYETGILQVLAEIGYVPKFKITNYYTKDYPIIFEIEKLTIIPPAFWTFSMIKEEAKLKIQILEVIRKFGYGFIDGHALNATFKDGKPIFFDFGSFVKGINNKGAYWQIYEWNIIPLMMMSLGDYASARARLVYINEKTFPAMPYLKSYEAKSAMRRFLSPKSLIPILKMKYKRRITVKEVDRMFENKYQSKTPWDDYNKGYKEGGEDERFQAIADKINKFSPDAKTLLDLAGNSGYTANYLSKRKDFERVICSDYDEMALEYGIKQFKDEKITFMQLNPVFPIQPVVQNIKSDVVCALAVTHHLLLGQNYNIDSVFAKMKEFTNKYIYVEFCPLGLYTPNVSNYEPNVPEWYTEEFFEEHFKKFYTLLDKDVVKKATVNGKECAHRVLFVGQIK